MLTKSETGLQHEMQTKKGRWLPLKCLLMLAFESFQMYTKMNFVGYTREALEQKNSRWNALVSMMNVNYGEWVLRKDMPTGLLNCVFYNWKNFC